jgi:capsule polysaccharide export protein KpsC/LpsZ
MQRLQQDEAFKSRLEKYLQQYQFQMQQMQNAQIGRIGTAPAQMGEMQTQGLTA